MDHSIRNIYLLICTIIFICVQCFSVSLAQNQIRNYLPDGAITRFGKGFVFDIDYSPDGSLLAVGSTIGIWIYDARTDDVSSVAFSPDGKVLASGSKDSTIRMWEVKTGILLNTLMGHTGDVQTVLFSSDSNSLVSGCCCSGRWDGKLCLWDVQTGELLLTLDNETVAAVTFSPDGSIITYANKNTIYFYDISTGEILNSIRGHTDVIDSLVYSSDEKTLISGSRDGTILIWDLEKSFDK